MRHIASALLIAGLATACVHAESIEQVRTGMTRDEVTALIGQPQGATNTAGRECALYTLTKDFWSRTPWSMTDRYYVCFTDGRVDSFGLAES